MKYIKKFRNLAEYKEFVESEGYVTPNLSWCEAEDEIKTEYIPADAPVDGDMWITAVYHGETVPIKSGESMTAVTLFDGEIQDDCQYFSEMQINGVDVPVINEFVFPTTDAYEIRFKINKDAAPQKGQDYSDSNGVGLNYCQVIPSEMFANCHLTDIVIPNGIKLIAESAFSNCRQLSGVTLPDTIEMINDYAFSNANNGNGIELYFDPKNLMYIARTAFYGTDFSKGTVNALIDDNVAYLGHVLFLVGPFQESSLVVKDGTRQIFKNAFTENNTITSITIPFSLVVISYDAFLNSSISEIHYNGSAGYFLERVWVEDGFENLNGITVYDEDGNEISLVPPTVEVSPEQK